MPHGYVHLSLLETVVGSISAGACLAVILTYFTFADIRTLRYVELVFYVSVSDLFGSIGVALGSNPDGSFACWFQGLTSNINYMSSVFWTTVITYQLWLAVYEGITLKDMTYIHIFCWFFPVVWALLPLTTNTYGNTEDDQSAWCFIADRKNSPAWGLVTWEWMSFYTWIWLTIFANTTMLVMIHVKLREILRTGITAAEEAKKLVTKVNKLVYYPIILMVCWAPSTVIDMISNVSVPNESDRGFMMGTRLSTVLACSQGWLLAVTFFTMNPIIRYKWYALWSGKPVVYKNRTTEKYTFDVDPQRDSDDLSVYSAGDEDDYVPPSRTSMFASTTVASGALSVRPHPGSPSVPIKQPPLPSSVGGGSSLDSGSDFMAGAGGSSLMSRGEAGGSSLVTSPTLASSVGTVTSLPSSASKTTGGEVEVRTYSITETDASNLRVLSRSISTGRKDSTNLDAVNSVLSPIFEDVDVV